MDKMRIKSGLNQDKIWIKGHGRASKIQHATLKGSVRSAMPEGVTDQMLCTLGIVKQIGNRKIVSVC